MKGQQGNLHVLERLPVRDCEEAGCCCSRPGSEIKLSRVGILSTRSIPQSPYVVDIFSYSELLICRTQDVVIAGKQAFAAVITRN